MEGGSKMIEAKHKATLRKFYFATKKLCADTHCSLEELLEMTGQIWGEVDEIRTEFTEKYIDPVVERMEREGKLEKHDG